MVEDNHKNLSERDQEMMGTKQKIPEIELAQQIDESEIPPPAPNVSIEQEWARYKKWAHDDWKRHLKAEKESEVREKEGYESPRNPDGLLNWNKVWQMLELKPPKRSDVFPDGEDKNLTDKEIEKKLNKYMEEHNIPLWSLSGIAPEEFPEIIDRDIRDLCLQINKNNWIKTKEGCSDHRNITKEDGKVVPAERGFQSPYLATYLDKKDPRNRLFTDKVREFIQQFKSKYPFIRVGTSEFPLRDEDLQKEDLESFHFGLSIDPSPEWMEKIKQEKRVDHFDDVLKRPDEIEDQVITIKPPRPESYHDEQSFVEAYARQYRIFNYQRTLYQQYEKRYYEKYGDFIRSEEAENIAKEFFEGIGKIIEEIGKK